MNDDHIYRCTRTCPINKKCFVLKTKAQLPIALAVLLKCPAAKKDIEITIGDDKNGRKHTAESFL